MANQDLESGFPADDSGENESSDIDKLFRDLNERLARGENIDPIKYILKHPEAEDELNKLFEQLQNEDEKITDVHREDENGGIGKIPRLLGDFRIIRPLGSGGMGTVYEAEQISLPRRVAIKVLSPQRSICNEAVHKFWLEAKALARQSHPGIVGVITVGEQDGIHFIAQELVVEGYSLQHRLRELRKTDNKPKSYFFETAELTAEIAEALQHAHDRGVIHRDIKPSNILLTEDGRPKVTDFGLARIEGSMVEEVSGEFSGTIPYMSPEQAASGRMGIDGRTDIFSLGLTLYEMMTFEPAFPGKTKEEVLKKILLAEPKAPKRVDRRIPSDLSVICMKALDKKVEDRYGTMQDLSDDLRSFIKGDEIKARSASLFNKSIRFVRSNPVKSTALLTSVVLLSLTFLIPRNQDSIIEEKQRASAEEKARAIEVSIAKELENVFTGMDVSWLKKSDLFTRLDKDLFVQVFKQDGGKEVPIGPYGKMRPGEKGIIVLRNESKYIYDVTTLHVDPSGKVKRVFPVEEYESARMMPSSQQKVNSYIVDDLSLGTEHLITIAVPREEKSPEINLSWLEEEHNFQSNKRTDILGRHPKDLKLGSPYRGMNITPSKKDNPGLQLFTWSTEWPRIHAPSTWLGSVPVALGVEKRISEQEWTTEHPNPWSIDNRAALAKSRPNIEKPDLLLTGNANPRQIFIDIDGDPGIDDCKSPDFPFGFDAEVCVHFQENEKRVIFYDKDNNGEFDIILIAMDNSGRAQTGFILTEDGEWIKAGNLVEVPWLSTRYLEFLEESQVENSVQPAIQKFKIMTTTQ